MIGLAGLPCGGPAAIRSGIPSSVCMTAVLGLLLSIWMRDAFPEQAAAGQRAAAVAPGRFCAPGSSPSPETEVIACTRLIEAGLDLSASYFRRGMAENRLRRFEAAIADYDRAIAIEPGNPEFFNARGDAWNNRGDHARAVLDYDATLRLNPRAAETLDNRCWAKAAWLHDPTGAVSDCEAALRLRPQHGNTLENIGFAYLQLGRLSDAVRAYSSALAENPSRPDSLFGRAIAEERLGRADEARADFARARRLNPRVDDEYRGYGIVAGIKAKMPAVVPGRGASAAAALTPYSSCSSVDSASSSGSGFMSSPVSAQGDR